MIEKNGRIWDLKFEVPLHLRSQSISRSQFRSGLKIRMAFHCLFIWELYWKDWTEL